MANGFNIVSNGSDFSTWGLGRDIPIDPYISGFNNAGGGELPEATLQELQTLYENLQADGVWNKINGLWPMAGTAASYHKLNFKNYADNDSALRLTFNNDSTGAHTAKGYKLSSSALRSANTHFVFTGGISAAGGVYISEPESATANACIMGGRTTSTTPQFIFIARRYVLTSQLPANVVRLGNPTGSVSSDAVRNDTIPYNKLGAYGVSNIGGTVKMWDDEASGGTVSYPGPQAGGTFSVYLGCYNSSGGQSLFSDCTIGTSWIAEGVTDTDVLNIIKRVKQFNIAMGR